MGSPTNTNAKGSATKTTLSVLFNQKIEAAYFVVFIMPKERFGLQVLFIDITPILKLVSILSLYARMDMRSYALSPDK